MIRNTLLALLALGCLNAQAINIHSTESRIWGQWKEVWWTASDDTVHTTSGSFSQSSNPSSGIARTEVSSPFAWNHASAYSSPLALNMSADSELHFIDEDWGTASLPGTRMDIFAESRMQFNPTSTVLGLGVNASSYWNYSEDEQGMSLLLRDLTSSVTLLDLNCLQEEDLDALFSLAVDPTHQYELALSGWITAWDFKEAHLRADVFYKDSAASVPDSGATLTLLGLALAGLVALKKAKEAI